MMRNDRYNNFAMPDPRQRSVTTSEATPIPARAPRRWLVLVHQLPSTSSNLRVRTWRRLQQLGALAIKQAVYLLPDSASAREDFEWLKTEIESAGGQASVFAADSVDTWSDDELVNAFRRARQDEYARLTREVQRVLDLAERPRAARRRRQGSSSQRLAAFQQRLTAIETIDFFGSAGRDRVVTLLDQLKERVRGAAPTPGGTRRDMRDVAAYRGRLWVTRPRPGIDRMGTAWLIKRFIDPAARFGFVEDRAAVPKEAIPFDMFGVEFSHQGDRCTFETLRYTFGIDGPAVDRLAGLIHDLDLKDARFGAPEAPTMGALIEGLQALYADDRTLLEQGMVAFEAFYRAFQQVARRAGPRPMAAGEARRARPSRTMKGR